MECACEFWEFAAFRKKVSADGAAPEVASPDAPVAPAGVVPAGPPAGVVPDPALEAANPADWAKHGFKTTHGRKMPKRILPKGQVPNAMCMYIIFIQ